MKKTITKIIYWLLSLTWGIIPTVLGFITTFILRCCGKCPVDNAFGLITEVGGNWGGLSLGPFAFCGNYSTTDKSWYDHTCMHEFGHSIQNALYGPFWIFIVAIPSAIRYWVIQIKTKNGKPTPEYDAIWFEAQATDWGERAYSYILYYELTK